ncbi:bacteriohemerythrin [Geothrix sp. 21YS21S-2]|uniref:bacteriohemerythrin n=1 Tax=Geothrix sp. 21YS21S-2 TaxID=3068893 RepID=UPI0027BA3F0F|nr:bacteriohemerythrin [Geothrix sp. 21YS21S-2]
MEFVEWTEKYTVGNPLVDAYHHIFFQMVTEFRKAMAEEQPPPMDDRIEFLVDYTLMHFDSEERWMAKVGYPDLEAHKEVHQNFRERMKELQRRYKHEPGSVTAEEVLYLVQDWFGHHILGTDMEFKGYGNPG